MKYLPIELHTHTDHSDGLFTPAELVEAAAAYGYHGLAITDHNTVSALQVIRELPGEPFPVLQGIEWTTYFGHLLVLGYQTVIDWRDAVIDNIDTKLKQLKADGAILGIAHPFFIGSPLCTGCHWQFQVRDWRLIDFIEIWNSTDPEKQFWSQRAYDFWLEKLRQGFRIFPAAGRDWHQPDQAHGHPALSCLGFTGDVTPDSIKDALSRGDLYITLGPRVEPAILQGARALRLGDTVKPGSTVSVQLRVSPCDLEAIKKYEITPEVIRLYQNDELLTESRTDTLCWAGTVRLGYLRFEVYGRFDGYPTPLVISAPLYISDTV